MFASYSAWFLASFRIPFRRFIWDYFAYLFVSVFCMHSRWYTSLLWVMARLLLFWILRRTYSARAVSESSIHLSGILFAQFELFAGICKFLQIFWHPFWSIWPKMDVCFETGPSLFRSFSAKVPCYYPSVVLVSIFAPWGFVWVVAATLSSNIFNRCNVRILPELFGSRVWSNLAIRMIRPQQLNTN
jgi:hypothetical protein